MTFQVGTWLIAGLTTMSGVMFAGENNLEPTPVVTVKFRIPEHDLYPESISYDEVSGDYFLSSMAQARILRIHADGSYEDFLDTTIPELASSVGMKIDAERRSLWVCTGHFSVFAGSVNALPGTGILQFNIDNGSLEGSWRLAEEQESPYHICNDMVLTRSGDLFVTTTLLRRIYRISPGVQQTKLIHELEPGSHNNGITLSPDEKFLFYTADRQIYRLQLDTGEVIPIEVPDEADLGTDGLYFYNSSLITVRPRFNSVLRLFLNEQQAAVTRVEPLVSDHVDMAYPTTGVVVGDELIYVATSYADVPRQDGAGSQHGDVLIHQISLD